MFTQLSNEQVDEMLGRLYGGPMKERIKMFFADTSSRFAMRTVQLVPGAEIYSVDVGYAGRGGKREFYFTQLSPTEDSGGIAARSFRWNGVGAEETAAIDFTKPAAFVTYRVGDGPYRQLMVPWNRQADSGYAADRPGFLKDGFLSQDGAL